MSIKQILHVFPIFPEKYCSRIKSFCDDNLDEYQHKYLSIQGAECGDNSDVESVSDLVNCSFFRRFLFLRRSLLAENELVIFHSLNYSGRFLTQLALIMKFTDLGSRTLWICWGADVYTPQKKRTFRGRLLEKLRKIIISKVRFISSVFKDEFELSRLRYNPNALYIELIYPNPMRYIGVESTVNKLDKKMPVRILAGNSADPRNNHEELFRKLQKIKTDIHIICPLSYGNKKYAKEVAATGQEIFGSSFEALFEFESPEKYAERMRTIDVAVFYHNRQQGFGVILQLLHMGKLVCVRGDTTAFNFLKALKLPVYDSFNIENLSIKDVYNDENSKGKHIVDEKFSDEAIIKLWKNNLRRLSSITIN